MSGPIVRKYGFPNFEKIFGERELKHGSESEAAPPASSSPPADSPKPSEEVETTKTEADKPKP